MMAALLAATSEHPAMLRKGQGSHTMLGASDRISHTTSGGFANGPHLALARGQPRASFLRHNLCIVHHPQLTTLISLRSCSIGSPTSKLRSPGDSYIFVQACAATRNFGVGDSWRARVRSNCFKTTALELVTSLLLNAILHPPETTCESQSWPPKSTTSKMQSPSQQSTISPTNNYGRQSGRCQYDGHQGGH